MHITLTFIFPTHAYSCLHISFIDIPLHVSSLFVLSYFISYHISYIFLIILHFTSCSCNCILSSHSRAMLLISYHILYTFPLHILLIFFYVHAYKYLRSGYRKELYVPKGTITVLYRLLFSICMYPKVLSLYKIVISI